MRSPRRPITSLFALALGLICAGTDMAEAQVTLPSLPGIGGGGGGNRGRRNRGSSMSPQARQALVNQLQNQLDKAQAILGQSESQYTSSQGSVESATSRMESAREAVKSTHADVVAANKHLEEVEEGILQAQNDSTEYGKLAAEYEQVQIKQDARMRELLALPPIPDDGLDPAKHRAQDLLHLKRDDRDKLDRDTEYTALKDQANKLSHDLKHLMTTLLEGDSNWTAADRARRDAAAAHQSANDDLRQASGEGVRARKEMQASQQSAAQMRGAIATLTAELKALGATPKTTTAGR